MNFHGNMTNTVISDLNSTVDSSKSNFTVNSSNQQNTVFTTSSSIQSSVANSVKMPAHLIRNNTLTHSPQIRLNVQNGNVDFNSPQISPLNDKNNNTVKNTEIKIKSKMAVDNITDLGVKRHVLKSFSSSSLPCTSSPSSSFSSPFANLKSNSQSTSNDVLNDLHISSKSMETSANDNLTLKEFIDENKQRKRSSDKNNLTITNDCNNNSINNNINNNISNDNYINENVREKDRDNGNNDFLNLNSKNEIKTNQGLRGVTLPFSNKIQGTYVRTFVQIKYILLFIFYSSYVWILFFNIVIFPLLFLPRFYYFSNFSYTSECNSYILLLLSLF
jgi:hypothetical protein